MLARSGRRSVADRLPEDGWDQRRRARQRNRRADRADGEGAGEVVAGQMCGDERGPGGAGQDGVSPVTIAAGWVQWAAMAYPAAARARPVTATIRALT